MKSVSGHIRERIQSPVKIRALVETIVDHGFTAEQALAGTGLTESELRDPHKLTSPVQYLRACSNVIALTDDPEIPFLVGQRLHLAQYGLYGFAVLCSATLRESIAVAKKYERLSGAPFTSSFVFEDGAAYLGTRGLDEDPVGPLGIFILKQHFTRVARNYANVLGAGFKPTKICFPYARPSDAEIYSKYLDCAVLFDQPSYQFHMDTRDLDAKPVLANERVCELVFEDCEQLLRESLARGMAGRVRRILTSRPGYLPDMEEVAKSLRLTSRTLRRRLDLEGGTFAEIADDVRKQIAMECLRTTNMASERIAARVGFTEGANFRRAFKKWTGKTPNEYRREMRLQQPLPPELDDQGETPNAFNPESSHVQAGRRGSVST